VQASQIFFLECGEEPDWSVVVHTESRSSRILQENDSDGTANVLEDFTEYSGEAMSKSESQCHPEVDIECSEIWGQHVTEADFIIPDADEGGLHHDFAEENSEINAIHEVGREEDVLLF